MKSWEFPYLGEISLDEAGKLLPALVLAVYVIGYVVVSIHLAHFGIIEGSPLRLKILAAGILFIVFLMLPVMASAVIFAIPSRGLSFIKITAIRFLAIPFVCNLLALTSYLKVGQRLSVHTTGSGATHLLLKWQLLVFLVLVGAYLSPILGLLWYSVRWKLAIAFLSISVFAITFISKWQIGSFAAFFWYVSITSLALLLKTLQELALLRNAEVLDLNAASSTLSHLREAMRRYSRISIFLFALLAVSLFSAFIYPKMPIEIGGGELVPVGVVLKEVTANMDPPGIKHQVYYLIDQSDQGVYLNDPKDPSSTLFVPKERIVEMLFMP